MRRIRSRLGSRLLAQSACRDGHAVRPLRAVAIGRGRRRLASLTALLRPPNLAARLGRRIMLTIGAKQLKHFVPLQSRATLFARILPSPISHQQAVAAGFAPHRLLPLRPPFSRSFNRSLFQKYGVDVLVTKASGIVGGVMEKVLAAEELGMQIVMIRRPQLGSTSEINTVAAAIDACRRLLAVDDRPVDRWANARDNMRAATRPAVALRPRRKPR